VGSKEIENERYKKIRGNEEKENYIAENQFK